MAAGTVQWGVRMSPTSPVAPALNERDARTWAKRLDAEVVSREVGPWVTRSQRD